jgi:membrane protein CcdC involved in cytochrome C biogenesis
MFLFSLFVQEIADVLFLSFIALFLDSVFFVFKLASQTSSSKKTSILVTSLYLSSGTARFILSSSSFSVTSFISLLSDSCSCPQSVFGS